jgi:hypothetical protein
MKIILGYFNDKAGKKWVFRLAVGNGSLHEIYNNNGVGVVNFATSKKCDCRKYNVPTM